MDNSIGKKARILMQKGVTIPNPVSVHIGPEVDPERVSGDGVMIFPGCRIYGSATLIMEGARLGEEGPVTIDDCRIGPGAELRGGFFRSATFLAGTAMGLGAHVREGCLLEEQSSGAHAVGLKQTILFPFVTLGSLINFCDCLMAGGTSRKDHSEVGSSYIHFNFTPHGDKATPSLIGDVPRGVMLNQPPIFLGGQGGLVGPSRIGYGTVIAAGTVFRGECPEGGKLVFGRVKGRRSMPFRPEIYWSINRRVLNNINYIAQLCALRQWYLRVRLPLFARDAMGEELFRGALDMIESGLAERVKRMRQMVSKLPASIEAWGAKREGEAPPMLIERKRELAERWPRIEELLEASREREGDAAARDCFLAGVQSAIEARGTDYVEIIRGLDPVPAARGSEWLQGIVDGINSDALDLLPSFSRSDKT